MKRNLLYLLILLIIILPLNDLFSFDRNTPWTIKVGGASNENIFLSDFNELPGYPSCCQKFDYANGIGYGLFAGFEYKLDNKLFGFGLAPDFIISYNDLSADYNKEEFLANLITGNDVTKAYVVNSLNTSIQAVLLEPGMNFTLPSTLPISFRLGFQLGLLQNKTFTQEERIKSPDWINYKETGTKTKYHYAGKIPNVNSFYASISLGANYKAMNFGNLSLNTFLQMNYGLSKIASNMVWNANSIQLGLSLNYNIPKPEFIPPQDAPLPPLPLPPKDEDLFFALDVSYAGKNLNTGDTVEIPIYERKFINKHQILPIIFYKFNSTEMVMPEDSKIRSEEQAQKISYKIVAKYLSENNKVNVRILSSNLDNEDSTIVNKRINNLLDYFKQQGISKNRVNISKEIQSSKGLDRKELIEDKIYIKFKFSDNTKMLTYRSDTTSKRIIEQIDFSVVPRIKATFPPVQLSGGFYVRNLKVFDIKNAPMTFTMREDIFKQMNTVNNFQFLIKATAKDAVWKEVNQKFVVNLKPELINDGVFENIISDIEQNNYVQQLVLGFCNFDKSDFYAVNNEAVEIAKKAFDNHKIIEIIPLFDFLGAEEHNQQLAIKRANSALKLLGLKKSDVMITIPKNYFFSNFSPYGRMLNRAVIIRIKDISSK